MPSRANPAVSFRLSLIHISSVTEWIRTVLEQLRSAILSGEVTTLPTLEELGDRICRVAARESLPSLRPVINATGVILHTNLGRGCLSDRAADAVYDIARGYSTLEYNVCLLYTSCLCCLRSTTDEQGQTRLTAMV